MQYPFSRIQEVFWGQSTMAGHYEGHCNTLIGDSVKHHVLIHFGLCYQKGIIHDQKDGVKL